MQPPAKKTVNNKAVTAAEGWDVLLFSISFSHSICFLLTESDSRQKISMENEKYQELQVKSQKMEEEYEKQLHNLEESKTKAVAELKEYYEKKLKHKSVLLEEVGSLIRSLIG